MLRLILEVFQSKEEVINQLKKNFNLEISLAVVSEVYNGEMPALVLHPEFSRFLAAIDARLEFDTYVFS